MHLRHMPPGTSFVRLDLGEQQKMSLLRKRGCNGEFVRCFGPRLGEDRCAPPAEAQSPLCVRWRGNTLAGTSVRGGASKRGTSVQWPVGRELAPHILERAVRLVFGPEHGMPCVLQETSGMDFTRLTPRYGWGWCWLPVRSLGRSRGGGTWRWPERGLQDACVPRRGD